MLPVIAFPNLSSLNLPPLATARGPRSHAPSPPPSSSHLKYPTPIPNAYPNGAHVGAAANGAPPCARGRYASARYADALHSSSVHSPTKAAIPFVPSYLPARAPPAPALRSARALFPLSTRALMRLLAKTSGESSRRMWCVQRRRRMCAAGAIV